MVVTILAAATVGIVAVSISISITLTIALLNCLRYDFVDLFRLHFIEADHLQLGGDRVLELRVPLNKIRNSLKGL
jgi:hypothetical protein